MRKIIAITAILTASVAQISVAADGVASAPLPGPYQFIVQSQITKAAPAGFAAPLAQQPAQPYWKQAPRQQVPYWMQGPQQTFMNVPSLTNAGGNRRDVAPSSQAKGQVQGGFGFNGQARGNSAKNQGYGFGSAPGYFPGYANVAQQGIPNAGPVPNVGYAPQRAPVYQNYQAAPYPQQQGWNMPWGQSFGPWGSGFPSGFGAPTGWGR